MDNMAFFLLLVYFSVGFSLITIIRKRGLLFPGDEMYYVAGLFLSGLFLAGFAKALSMLM